VAEVQAIVTTVTATASFVPGLGSIAGGFGSSVNDPLLSITGLLENLVEGILLAVTGL